ncbi:MAG: S1 RNA-binding domain-containing protein [Candidatus Pacebacteria bacterium]|nr:S1 RNA-binding domain-containing protein [Candidatus Paceibacterota bacterium]
MSETAVTKAVDRVPRSGVVPMAHAVSAEAMQAALQGEQTRSLEIGDLVEGTVVSVQGSYVYVDVPPYGTGVIYGREYMAARDMVRNMNIGDTIKGKVVDRENENGYMELSLKEARQALVWSDAEKAMKAEDVMEITVKEANKGGLIVEWQGIPGFLPASQLKADHYPRVDDGNKDDILRELKKLVGVKISVMIIGVQPKEGKLIFSEKGNAKEGRKEIATKYNVGDELDCSVSGIVDFGVFLKIEEGLEGLVHISEIDWSLVEDPRTMFKMGDKVRAKIIEIKEGKISLSIKALKQDPWTKASGSYKKDDEVSGVVIKFNKHGALISIEEGVAGLVHVSEFGDEKKLRTQLMLGKSYKFKITLFEPKEHRMTLSFVS